MNQEALDEITHNGGAAHRHDRAHHAASLLVGRRRAHRRRGHRRRRARRSASPSRRTRRRTLTWMAVILGTAFFGLAVLAHRLQPTVSEDETLLSIMGKAVFGAGHRSCTTCCSSRPSRILILAANTAFADFPRLSSIIARDGFLPRQLANRGDRLVFSNGIVFLAALASRAHRRLRRRHCGADPALRGRRVHRLHPVAVRHGPATSARSRQPGWQRRSVISLVGSIATFIVLLVVVVSKFTKGAWIPAVVIPAIVAALRADRAPLLAACARRSTCRRAGGPSGHTHNVVVLVGGVNRGVLNAITYARSLAPGPAHRGDRRERRARAGAHLEAVGRVRDRRSSSTSFSRRTASSPGRCCATSTSSTARAPTTSSRSSSLSSS